MHWSSDLCVCACACHCQVYGLQPFIVCAIADRVVNLMLFLILKALVKYLVPCRVLPTEVNMHTQLELLYTSWCGPFLSSTWIKKRTWTLRDWLFILEAWLYVILSILYYNQLLCGPCCWPISDYTSPYADLFIRRREQKRVEAKVAHLVEMRCRMHVTSLWFRNAT